MSEQEIKDHIRAAWGNKDCLDPAKPNKFTTMSGIEEQLNSNAGLKTIYFMCVRNDKLQLERLSLTIEN